MSSLTIYPVHLLLILSSFVFCLGLKVDFPLAEDVSECSNITIKYSGASGATRFLIVGPRGPSRAFNMNSGNAQYPFEVNYAAGRTMSFTVEDAVDSFTSNLYTVNNRQPGTMNCSWDPGYKTRPFFFFNIEPLDGPVQCKPFVFNYNYTPPAFTYFIVPGQKAFRSSSAPGGPEKPKFTWPQVRIPSGTQVLLTMFSQDLRYSGGSGDLYTVGASDDTSCLQAGEKKGLSGAAIGGIAAAGVLGSLVIAALAWFWFCKRKRRSHVVDLDLPGETPAVQPFPQTPPAYSPSNQSQFEASQMSNPDMQYFGAAGLRTSSNSRPISLTSAGFASSGIDNERRVSDNTTASDSSTQYQTLAPLIAQTKEHGERLSTQSSSQSVPVLSKSKS